MFFCISIFTPIFNEVFKNISATNIIIYSQILFYFIGIIIILNLVGFNKGKIQSNLVDLKRVLLWILVGVFLSVATQLVITNIENILFDYKGNSQNTVEILNRIKSNWLSLLVPVIFAPVMEEIVFRKVIFGAMLRKTNFFIASLLSSVLFAIAHFDPIHFFAYTSVGIILSFLYVKSKKIIVPITVHIILNTIPVLVLFFA